MRLFGFDIRKSQKNTSVPQPSYTGSSIFSYSPYMTVGELMANGTVNACVNLISDAVACLPLIVYRKTKTGRIEATDSPLYHILKDCANPETMPYTFKKQIMLHLLLRGNTYIFQERIHNKIDSLTAINPEKVEIKRDAETNEIYYLYRCDGQTYKYTSDQLLHIPAMRWDGVTGLSPLEYASNAAHSGLTLDRYTDDYFGGGIHTKLMITVPAEERNWKEEDSKQLSQRIQKAYGGVENATKPFILSKGMTAAPLNLATNTDAQLTENRNYSEKEVAKIFRVPLTMLGASDAKYNNNEQQSQNFLQNTLTPWLVLIQEYFRQLIPVYDRDNMYVEFNTNAMLRADSKSRMQVYQQGLMTGMYTLNQINQMENQPLIDPKIGDVRFMPVNLAPVTPDYIDAYMAAQKAKALQTAGSDTKTGDTNNAGN